VRLYRPAQPGDRRHGTPFCECLWLLRADFSATYPNVLALDYMKRSGKLTPEVHARPRASRNGYSAADFRSAAGLLLVRPGAANKILTAYGLMEFGDMARFTTGSKLIQRTSSGWPDSSRKMGVEADTVFINEGHNRYNRTNSDYRLHRVALETGLRGRRGEGPPVRGGTMGDGPTRNTWQWWPTSPPITERTASSPAAPCKTCWTRASRRASSWWTAEEPACTEPAKARPWKPPDWRAGPAKWGQDSPRGQGAGLPGLEETRGHLGN